MQKKPVLSIIIVNYNTKKLLSQCLESIWKNPPPFPTEIIIVDNNSTDGSREYLEKLKYQKPMTKDQIITKYQLPNKQSQ